MCGQRDISSLMTEMKCGCEGVRMLGVKWDGTTPQVVRASAANYFLIDNETCKKVRGPFSLGSHIFPVVVHTLGR